MKMGKHRENVVAMAALCLASRWIVRAFYSEGETYSIFLPFLKNILLFFCKNNIFIREVCKYTK